ncbi:MAG: hypothetical protein ACREQ5_29990, partial [Candidatus Dormibacteria bacterium]
MATFKTETFKDGESSDGAPTAEEQAAHEANEAPAAGAEEEDVSEDAEEPAEVEEDAADSAKDAEAAAGDKPADPAKPAEGKKGGKKSVDARFADITAARRTAERLADSEKSRADRLQAEVDALKSGKAPLTDDQTAASSGAVPPDPSQFDYGELDPKYIAALARFETAQALKAHAADEETTRQSRAADAKRQELGEKQDKLVRAGLDLHDDFDEVVMQGAREGKWDLSPALGELILDSEFGGHIAYALAKDPDESRRVAKLSAPQQAAYFGRQEAKFEAAKASQGAKAPKPPQAPPPPKT